jgi:hypothetical protein
MSNVSNYVLAGASGQSAGGGAAGDDSRSLRFHSTDSASLTRSVTTKGNTKKFTFSCWVKRTKLGAFPHNLLSGSTGTDAGSYLCFPDNASNALGTADSLVYKSDNGAGGGSVGTYSVFRDTSAWYHIVLAVDTQANSNSDKVKIYVNGVEEELQSTASPGWPHYDSELSINDVGKAAIGAELNDPYGTRFHGDFLLAEVHFIDGQQLTPSSFGAFDATTGVWDPIEVTGLTYGTNGFYLDFKDNSSKDALGTDTSGEGNDFDVNNLVANSSGTVYSTLLTASGGSTTVSNPVNAFNGSTSNYAGVIGTNTTNTLTFTRTFSGVTSFRIYASSTDEYSVNGGAFATLGSGDGSAGWYDLTAAVTGGTLSSLAIRQFYGGTSYFPRLHAVEINGAILVDAAAAKDVDPLLDHPTNGDTANDTGLGGQVSGNYCIWNPVAAASQATLSQGNLNISAGAPGASSYSVYSTIGLSSGKWYWEATAVTAGTNSVLGISISDRTNIASGSGLGGYGWQAESATKIIEGNFTSGYGSAATTGSVVMFALDMENLKFYVGKDGTWLDSGDPETGTNPLATIRTGTYRATARPYHASGTCEWAFNWGQREFAHPAPDGFKSVCTANLPDPAVADGSKVMDAQRWDGNSTNGRVISQYNFKPELVWIKNRTNTGGYNWIAVNSVRGAGKYLTTSANNTESTFGYVSAFNSNGFTLSNHTEVNGGGNYYVGYCWDATGVSQSNYDPESTGAPVNYVGNTSAGFSIVECQSPNATQPRAHGCGGVPQFIMAKAYADSGEAWHIYHGALGKGYYGVMGNSSIAQNPFNSSDQWGSSDPTNSLFYVKPVTGSGANDAAGMIYFIWSAVEGYSSFGKYTGNGSSDGPMLNVGFRPSVIIIKNAFVSNDWKLYDTGRSRYNTTGIQQPVLYPSLSNNEDLNYGGDFLSNGYKIRDTNQALNTSGDTYLYCAWAENPFKYSRAR